MRKQAIIVIAGALLWGCAPGAVESEDRHVSIAYLKSLYRGHPVTFAENYIIRGYVTSTDLNGNFYRTLFVQDETAGLEIKLDRARIYRDFRKWDVVEVSCGGLTLGSFGGMKQLGSAPEREYEVGYIADRDVDMYVRVVKDAGFPPPEPKTFHISQPNDALCGTLVSVGDVQFIEEEIGECWAAADVYATDRHLVNATGDTMLVRTLSTADFASTKLPSGSGTITGILSIWGSAYQLRIIWPYDADMTSERLR